MSAMILTGQGVPLIVDRADLAWLSQFVWTVSNTGGKVYARATIDGASVYMHRMILGLETGDGMVGDHINGCTVDNRRRNLRAVSVAVNAQSARVKRTSETGVKGVSIHKPSGKYTARIRLNGKRVNLGYFDTVTEAAAAYEAAEPNRNGEKPQ